MKTLYSKLLILLSLVIILNTTDLFACTSVIVSGNYTESGKPLMIKNRDTGELNNRIEYFIGPKYNFIGLVNSPEKEYKEVWAGTNQAGFCIMNTASYNIKDDNVPDSEMDGEGILMYKALGVCADVDDFEYFLDTLSKPMHVEANFGIIDAEGGAVYYEVNNYKWVKYDVNDKEVAPDGYRVVTNFCESGRKEEYEGWERYLTASAIMKDFKKNKAGKYEINHSDLLNSISRSYRHEWIGIKNLNNYDIFVDQDFIPRKSTSASVVFEGVKKGNNPKYTLMWTLLGYPSASVSIPLFVGDSDHIPFYMKKSAESENSQLCDYALKMKDKYIFHYKISNGNRYMDVKNIRKMKGSVQNVEKFINSNFNNVFVKWERGEVSDKAFYQAYSSRADNYYRKYLGAFVSLAKND